MNSSKSNLKPLAEMRIKHRLSKPGIQFVLESKTKSWVLLLYILQNELAPSHLSQTQTAALPCPHVSKNHKVHIIPWHHNNPTASQEHFPSFCLSACEKELSAWLGESDKDDFSRRDLPHLN